VTAASNAASRRERTFFNGVPYPQPTSTATTAVMKANRSKNTGPELALRAALHRAGRRFRIHLALSIDPGRPIVVDIVFPRRRIAVFVDGCFWHSCPAHGVEPAANAQYWKAKFALNRDRDRSTVARLQAAGWTVIRVWEHETVQSALGEVEAALAVESASFSTVGAFRTLGADGSGSSTTGPPSAGRGRPRIDIGAPPRDAQRAMEQLQL
jgi:DNA mismatch endonuclease (patch repair protein)